MLTEKFLGRHPSHFKINPIVKAFIIAETFLWSAQNFIIPIISIFVIRDIQHGNVQIAASAVSIYYVTRVFTELLTGRLFSKTNDKQKLMFTIFGMLLLSVSYIGFMLSYTIVPFIVFYGLTGVGLGIATPPKNALFSMHLDAGKETTEWSFYDALTFIGMAFATALGGFIAATYGFRVLFIISSVVNFLGIIPYLLYIF